LNLAPPVFFPFKKIMLKPAIHFGDPTSTGGKVITASPDLFDDGIAVARANDLATCPVCGRNGVIVTVAETQMTDQGLYIAREGDYVACDCPQGSNLLISADPKAMMVDEVQPPIDWGAVLGGVCFVLDVVSLIPVAGNVASGIEAGIDLATGNFAEAAIDAAGMIPGVGEAAKAGKLAFKVGKDVVKAVEDGSKIAKDIDKGAEAIAKTTVAAKEAEKAAKTAKEAEGAGKDFEKAAHDVKPKPKEKEPKAEKPKEKAPKPKKAKDKSKIPSKPTKQGAWKNAPNPEKWTKKGGKVKRTLKGGLKYTDAKGKSVIYDKKGYPDFSRYETSDTGIKDLPVKGLNGSRPHDNRLSNEAAMRKLLQNKKLKGKDLEKELSKFGEPSKKPGNIDGYMPSNKAPNGYTWHHVGGKDGKMQLVDSSTHREFSHKGSASDL
jgi:uncharacterized Zn-binding protein involved in type VI secretion